MIIDWSESLQSYQKDGHKQIATVQHHDIWDPSPSPFRVRTSQKEEPDGRRKMLKIRTQAGVISE